MFGKPKTHKILDKLDGEMAIMEIFDILYPVFMNNIMSMTAEELNFCFVEYLECEVNGDGFDAFFSNSYGDFYYETLLALDKIGAYKFKSILKKAAKPFPEGRVPVERSEREDLIFDSEELRIAFDESDKEFYAAYQEEDIHSLLLDYVRRNIANFR